MEKEQELEQIMGKLSPRQKQIIQMRADGYSYKEIAKELGIKIGTIKWHLEEGRKRAKQLYPLLNHSKKSYITKGETKEMNSDYYLNQIEPELKKKAYVYWRDWDIKGMEWEDLAQELRIHLINKFNLFNPEKSLFRTWANRVMMNKIKDIVRGNYSSSDVLNQSNTLSTEELLENGLDINNYGEIVKEGD